MPDAPSQPLHLYLLIGQSNMAGRGRMEEVPALKHPRVWMRREHAWLPASEPLHTDKPELAGVGLGMQVGVDLAEAEPSASIGLLPCAVGGTGLNRWMPGADLYTQAMTITQGALADGGTMRGILWHQGEQDAGDAELTASYATRLRQMLEHLRAELQAPELPVVTGELGHFLGDAPNASAGFVKVNAQLRALAEELPACRCVSAEGLADQGDSVHFSAAALREFGHRYARALRELT